MEQKWTNSKGETDNTTTKVRDFDIPFSIVDTTTTQKINEKIEDLCNWHT